MSNDISLGLVDDVLNVSLHTLDVNPIVTELKKYGEVISFNLENTKLTNAKEEIPFKAIVYIASVSGSGVENLYREMGVDIFLSMNPSTQDYLDAFKKINAERIVILPNDKNIIETAHLAAKLSNQNNITILHTKNVIEGYYSLAMDVPDSSIANRLEAIQESVGVECINVSKAIKNYTNDSTNVKVDDFVVYEDDKVLEGSSDLSKAIINGLKKVEDIDSKSSAFILLGAKCEANMEDRITKLLGKNFPNIEPTILEGGQDKELLIIGLL